MDPLFQFAAALLGVLVIYSIVHRWTRISIADIPGPEPESFLLGCLPELLQSQAGEADFKWQARFGDVVRVRGILGTDRLLVSDPKALHHIYNSGYNIRKQPFRTVMTRIITGPGRVWANNEAHRRQRRVNSPAFGANEARSYVPIFTVYARLSAQWKELAVDGSAVVNAPPYFARFFLDVIGEVAFDYQFGATDDAQNPLAVALSSIIPAVFSSPSKTKIFVAALMELLPTWMFQLFVSYAPLGGLRISRRVEQMAVGFAKELVDEKAEALMAGKGKRDIMSLLVKANASTNPRTSLSEAEMLAQMQTIMQAGHETTANTMSWTMFALTQHPDVQTKLRTEILATEKAIHARVMKETYRFHPVVHQSFREAARDEILPLSKPLITKSGKIINEIPIPKNMSLWVSNAGYNRNTDIFGQDAHVFNPERWLDGTVQTTTKLGVYGNLMTFGSGIRSCIGWRFAVYEYQAFLVELVKNFEFSMDASTAGKIRRAGSMVMVPSISGEKESQLPITIRPVDTL
ncbi:cytochrome P450 [Mycena epipterygia]|nr:cytochrome P450 [Mycena epipterygia]